MSAKNFALNTNENCFLNELYFHQAYMVGYCWVDFRLSINCKWVLNFLRYFFNVK